MLNGVIRSRTAHTFMRVTMSRVLPRTRSALRCRLSIAAAASFSSLPRSHRSSHRLGRPSSHCFQYVHARPRCFVGKTVASFGALN